MWWREGFVEAGPPCIASNRSLPCGSLRSWEPLESLYGGECSLQLDNQLNQCSQTQLKPRERSSFESSGRSRAMAPIGLRMLFPGMETTAIILRCQDGPLAAFSGVCKTQLQPPWEVPTPNKTGCDRVLRD